jgi:hypothetical protein
MLESCVVQMLMKCQIASVIEETWSPRRSYLAVHVDVDAIRKLQVRL